MGPALEGVLPGGGGSPQKQDPYICCLQETHLKTGDTYRLKVKGWKKIFHANRDQRKAGLAILISDKIDFICFGAMCSRAVVLVSEILDPPTAHSPSTHPSSQDPPHILTPGGPGFPASCPVNPSPARQSDHFLLLRVPVPFPNQTLLCFAPFGESSSLPLSQL